MFHYFAESLICRVFGTEGKRNDKLLLNKFKRQVYAGLIW